MNYPQNYDFKMNWKTKIVPHLDNQKLLKAIRNGVNNYSQVRRYRKNIAPAYYSSNDYYYTLMNRKEELIIEKLRNENKLPPIYIKLEKQIDENYKKDDEDEVYELEVRLSKMQKNIF